MSEQDTLLLQKFTLLPRFGRLRFLLACAERMVPTFLTLWPGSLAASFQLEMEGQPSRFVLTGAPLLLACLETPCSASLGAVSFLRRLFSPPDRDRFARKAHALIAFRGVAGGRGLGTGSLLAVSPPNEPGSLVLSSPMPPPSCLGLVPGGLRTALSSAARRRGRRSAAPSQRPSATPTPTGRRCPTRRTVPASGGARPTACAGCSGGPTVYKSAQGGPRGVSRAPPGTGSLAGSATCGCAMVPGRSPRSLG